MTDLSEHTHIVILGGSGDLSQRKLFPALIDLYCKDKLPEHFTIIGVARTPRSSEAYRSMITEAMQHHEHDHTDQEIAEFCTHVDYLAGSFTTPTTFSELQHCLTTLETTGAPANRLFYLAIPPTLYSTVFTALYEHQLATPDRNGKWSRILVEKPFGSDLETAKALDAELSALYDESQIYRIDHYLAKEAVQNILSFRFSNTLLQPAWDRHHIDTVRITMHETIDVGERAGFYEGIGALRDVGQNHLLQLLALVAMDEPTQFTADAIRTKRAEVLNDLSPLDPDTVSETVVRAHYEGYQDTRGVADDSSTETFFSFVAHLNNERWRGVPFFVEAGKALAEKKVEIEVRFTERLSTLFDTTACRATANRVTLTIQPEQAMRITLNAKAPGLGYQLENRELSFVCCKAGDEGIENSYEKVLYDCITGDQTLFTTSQEVIGAWRFIESILHSWHTVPVQKYTKGSTGPDRPSAT